MKKIIIIVFILISVAARSNPVVRGTWVGYIVSNDQMLPATLYITDDNDVGISGEIMITYNYTYGKTYSCKARFSGNIDYKTYEFSLVMEEFVYYDLLPEGKKWCLGSFYGTIRREMELKEYLIQATMKSKCSEIDSKVVMLKQQ